MSKPVDSKIALRGDRIRRLREQRGWSQRELAQRCGFSDGQIRKYEDGTMDPSSTYLKRIADQFGVSTDYLLDATDDPRGHIGDGQIDDDERVVLETFRRDGWLGLARLGMDKLTER